MAGEKVYIADKETLDKIYNILAVDPIYGFIEHSQPDAAHRVHRSEQEFHPGEPQHQRQHLPERLGWL